MTTTFPIIVLQHFCLWNDNNSHLFPLKSASLSGPPCRANDVVLVCLNRCLDVCIKMKLLTRKDLSCILCRGMAYHGLSLAHMIFLGARNSWKARHVGPRLHVISRFIFHSARRQMGLHWFADTSHIQNKLKKYTHFLWQEAWGVFSQYGCVREHTVQLWGCGHFLLKGEDWF